ncbi:MAG: NAD(P)H-dependent oxidoreductase [Prevotellaceae bacterium]|nr:NAD(P)H-dependent oxidoreductase [Prevotellaceae bacterium]
MVLAAISISINSNAYNPKDTNQKSEENKMKKTLVAYFSASGNTAKLARTLATVVDGDLHEIQPKQPYTAADLDWHDSKSRSSVEMNNKAFRPEIANKVDNMEKYDTIYIGFPIWWYVAPTIINTFLEQYDLKGKTIIPFATSGSSGMGNTNAELKNSCTGATLRDGKRFDASASAQELKKWTDGL